MVELVVTMTSVDGTHIVQFVNVLKEVLPLKLLLLPLHKLLLLQLHKVPLNVLICHNSCWMQIELWEVKLPPHPFHGKLLYYLVLSNFVEQQFWMLVLYCVLHIVNLQPHIVLGLAQFQKAVEVRPETLPRLFTIPMQDFSIILVLWKMILLFLNWIVH